MIPSVMWPVLFKQPSSRTTPMMFALEVEVACSIIHLLISESISLPQTIADMGVLVLVYWESLTDRANSARSK